MGCATSRIPPWIFQEHPEHLLGVGPVPCWPVLPVGGVECPADLPELRTQGSQLSPGCCKAGGEGGQRVADREVAIRTEAAEPQGRLAGARVTLAKGIPGQS